MDFIPFSYTLILLCLLAALSFLFSASETAIIGLSKIRLKHMVSRGSKRAASLQRVIGKLDKFIAAILIFNNFINIAISALITGLCLGIYHKWGILIATVVAGIFVVILCEITPKVIAIKQTERIALIVAPFWEVFIKIFNPVIVIFSSISGLIIKALRIKPAKRSPLITEEELRMMIEVGKDEGFVSEQESRMLQRIFEFGDTCVGDVMVPKDTMVAVSIDTTPEQLLDIFVEQGHARLPVYQGTRDNIVGIVYAHDLLYILRDKGLFLLQDLLHEAYFVAKEMQVNELLKKFQADKLQIAIVVGEKKKTLGLVTLEDLIEEIVGEIEEKQARRGRRNP